MVVNSCVSEQTSPETRFALLTDRESSFIELIVTIFMWNATDKWAGIAQSGQRLGEGLNDRGIVFKFLETVRSKAVWSLS